MSLGHVALGLASIALGLRQLSNGVSQISRAGRVPQFQRTAQQRKPRYAQRNSGGHSKTPSGAMRMRTFGEVHRRMPLEERIKHLRALVEQGKRDEVVYEFARRAINGKCGGRWCVPEKDNLAELKALFAHMRKNVRYTSDIHGIDTYQTPRHTIAMRTADCDDYSVLACATAATLGMPCRFKVIRTKDAGDWNHIYAQIGYPRKQPTRWISFDASVEAPLGWEAPERYVAASRVFPT